MIKLFFIFSFLIVSCSSKTPVAMDEVLWERGGQYITADNYSSFFYFNQKVYNGPGFLKYRSGEKKEEGSVKNGFKAGAWTGWDKKGNKKFTGEYKKGKAHGQWTGFHINGKKKYEGKYELGFQTGSWAYYNKNGKKNLEELYYVCTDECKDAHPPNRKGSIYICEKLGRIKETKDF